MAEKTILVVEDEAIVAEAIAESLKKQGYGIVAIVTNGEEAIEKASQTKPDLVLMDIVLEGNMDGIAAAEEIRTRLYIPTVFLTAYADEETLKRAKITEPLGYIIKPFQQKDLYVTIEIALQRHELETKMRLALETAEAKASRQTKYVSIAAHELRNPLNAIVGTARLLEYSNNLDEETQLKCLNLMTSAGQTMNQMIEDMLIIGRAESDQLKFNPTPLNLIEFCRHLVEKIQLNIEDKQRITFSYYSDISFVVMDQRLLQHILYNLLSNAIKYSPKDSKVFLELEYIEKDDSNSREIKANYQLPITNYPTVIFRIQDSGIGILKADQEKLFEAFYRCSNVGEIKGTGLGLTIVKKAVELHGGAIAVDSKVGTGTTFTVILPSANIR